MSTYVDQIVPQAITDICEPPENDYSRNQLLAMMQGGVASDGLVPDPATGRISVAQIQNHVKNMMDKGTLSRRPQIKVGMGYATDMNKLVPQDADMFKKLRDEYCYYEKRYRFALKKFLMLGTSRNAGDNDEAQQMLQVTKTLNLRTNSVLEIMNYMAQSRVDEVNSNKQSIDTINTNINGKLSKLNQTYNMLSKDNVIVNTQKASVKYTEEKNNYTTNQISVWAALNVVALATIFYVYRS
jgi:hypothetical protein